MKNTLLFRRLSLGTALLAGWSVMANAVQVREYTAPIAPNTVVAGQQANFQLTIANSNSSTQNIQSATVQFPGAFTLITPPAPSTTGGSAQSGSPSWSTVCLAGTCTITKNASSRVLPGESIVLAFTAEATCPIDPASYSFTTAAFQGADLTTAFTLVGVQPAVSVTGSCDACESWRDETAWAEGTRYVQQGNWATYTGYVPGGTKKLYAGQTYDAGTVQFSAPNQGQVTITITLNAGFRFADVEENVKVQGYSDAPSGNPSPGLFDHKDYADPASSNFAIVVPQNNYYGVHVDVERCLD